MIDLARSESPYDGSPQDVLERVPIIGITVFLYLLASIGFIFVVAALVFNLLFKNRRSVENEIKNNKQYLLSN